MAPCFPLAMTLGAAGRGFLLLLGQFGLSLMIVINNYRKMRVYRPRMTFYKVISASLDSAFIESSI